MGVGAVRETEARNEISKGAKMNNLRKVNINFETIAWGAFFVWWGITDSDFGLYKSLPPGTSWVGVGVILLGLNVARALNGIPTSGFTLALGSLALVLGGLKLARTVLSLPPFDVSLFAILLVVFGVVVLVRALNRSAGWQQIQND
jgi:hypothetical protein